MAVWIYGVSYTIHVGVGLYFQEATALVEMPAQGITGVNYTELSHGRRRKLEQMASSGVEFRLCAALWTVLARNQGANFHINMYSNGGD